MFWNLVATVFAGLGAAGIGLGIRALTRKKAPKWIIPVFAGLGMMGYQIYMEYTWFDQMTARMPAESVVVSTEAEAAFWRPWSFFVPQINRFTILDTSSVERRTVSSSTVAQFQLYHFRHTYGGRVSHGNWLLNCGSREMVALTDEGQPNLNDIRQLDRDNTLYNQVCT